MTRMWHQLTINENAIFFKYPYAVLWFDSWINIELLFLQHFVSIKAVFVNFSAFYRWVLNFSKWMCPSSTIVAFFSDLLRIFYRYHQFQAFFITLKTIEWRIFNFLAVFRIENLSLVIITQCFSAVIWTHGFIIYRITKSWMLANLFLFWSRNKIRMMQCFGIAVCCNNDGWLHHAALWYNYD